MVDCDVIQADGGTRCASITGGWVALRLAVNKLLKADLITSDPIIDHVAAVSCGIYAGQSVLDLDYAEDSEAGTDGNFILTGAGKLIEVQMSAEGCDLLARADERTAGPRRSRHGGAGRRAEGRRGMRQFTGDRLLVATHNAGKLEEIAAMLRPFGIACVGAAELGLPEPAETEFTFVGNARIKAHAAAKATGLPALSDDSGIEVDALDGAPGVYTADWAETPQGRDFTLAMTRTWDAVQAKGAPFPRTRRGFAAPSCWPGPTGMTRCSRAGSRGRSSGRCGAHRGTAMTRCSSPTATR